MPSKDKNPDKGKGGYFEKGSKSVAPTSIPKPSPPAKQPSKDA